MAIHHGNISKYLKDQVENAQSSQSAVAFVGGIVLGGISSSMFFLIPSLGYSSWLGVSLLLAFVVIVVVKPVSAIYMKKEKRFSKGMRAESRAYFTLRGLSDRYHTFQGVVFTEKKGDIDFAVIGPTGVLQSR